MEESNSMHVELDVALDRDRVLRGEKTRVQLVVQVEAAWEEGATASRVAPMEVVFVLDTSGSMTGEPMRQVLHSVDVLTNLLESRDRVAVVSFADRASLALSLQPCTAEVKGKIRKRLRRIFASGSTNIEAGLVRAQSVWGDAAHTEARRVLLLMSDGVPNAGLTQQDELCGVVARLRPQISLSTLGFGPHHHEDILAAMAQRGAGGYFFIPDPSVCDVEFASALGEQGDVLLGQTRLEIATASGVDLVRVVGSVSVEEEGSRHASVALPDLLDGRSHVFVIELDVEGAFFGGEQEVAEVVLTGLVPGLGAITRFQHVRVGVGKIPGRINSSARARSLMAHAEETRVKARLLADEESFDRAAMMLRSAMDSIDEALSMDGDQAALLEVQELLRDEVGIMERKPDREAYKKFKRHSMAVDLTSSAVTGSGKISRSNMRSMLIRSLTSGMPRASLRVVEGVGVGSVYPLGEDQVLGRTSSADIQVRSHEVSRRHLRIVARSDGFYAIDLGSTNATRINDHILEAVQRLEPGDRVRIGGVVLLYEEISSGSKIK